MVKKAFYWHKCFDVDFILITVWETWCFCAKHDDPSSTRFDSTLHRTTWVEQGLNVDTLNGINLFLREYSPKWPPHWAFHSKIKFNLLNYYRFLQSFSFVIVERDIKRDINRDIKQMDVFIKLMSNVLLRYPWRTNRCFIEILSKFYPKIHSQQKIRIDNTFIRTTSVSVDDRCLNPYLGWHFDRKKVL